MEERTIHKIAIVGAESSGKTWLCENLAAHCKTTWVPEYAREYFNDSDIYNYTLDDLITIAKRQIELEEKLITSAAKFLFCDTTLITLKIWAILEFTHTPSFIEEHLAKVKYDYYFITNNEMPWVEDSLRQNKHSRELLFQMNEAEVKKSGIPYSVVTGVNDDRLKFAINKLNLLFQ